MATIKDVAKAANVSTATVSRVINQSDSVLPETVAKVESVMAQLGYQIKDNRRLTINQGQDTIGLIVSRFHSPFDGFALGRWLGHMDRALKLRMGRRRVPQSSRANPASSITIGSLHAQKWNSMRARRSVLSARAVAVT